MKKLMTLFLLLFLFLPAVVLAAQAKVTGNRFNTGARVHDDARVDTQLLQKQGLLQKVWVN